MSTPSPAATSGLLRIVHHTAYRYTQALSFQPHRLVVRPREGHDLRVEDMAVLVSPACQLLWSRDVFGNLVAQAFFTEPANELSFHVDILVRRFLDAAPPLPATLGAAFSYPLNYDELELPALAIYLAPLYPGDAPVIREWLRSLSLGTEPASASAEEIVLALTTAIHHGIRYQRREEKGVQSPAATLALGTASCRDLATLLMESLRHLGIATRFCSGYLDCAATRAARGSTHAWIEAYFPGLGWRGYDPTTGKRCTHQHIVTGVSYHPRGVMPISGRYSGPPGVLSAMQVTVEFSTPGPEAGQKAADASESLPLNEPPPAAETPARSSPGNHHGPSSLT